MTTTTHARPRGRRHLARSLGAAVVSLVLLAGGSTAVADYEDELAEHDRQLRQQGEERDRNAEQREELESRLEGTNEDLAAIYLALEDANARLPVAEEALARAQDDLAAAQREERAVADRLAVADAELADLAADLVEGEAQIEAASASIGELARSAYRGDASLSGLAVVLDADSSEEFVRQAAVVDTAVRNQTKVITDLEDVAAVNRNRELRQAAVRDRVDQLHAQAEEAVAAADAARAAADAHRQEIADIQAEQTELAAELEALQGRLNEDLAQREADDDRLAGIIAGIEADRRQTVEDERQRQAEIERQRQAELERQAEAERQAERERQAEQERQTEREAAARSSDRGSSGGSSSSSSAGSSSSSSSGGSSSSSSSSSGGGSGGGGGGSGAITPPVPNPLHVTSAYGYRIHPIAGYRWWHAGVDLRSACGNPQYAAASGTVNSTIPAAGNGSHGNQVIIDHGTIDGSGYVTVTNHLTGFGVSPGQQVNRGDVIGYTGQTGNVTGCHVHFEVWRNGSTIDPMGLPGWN